MRRCSYLLQLGLSEPPAVACGYWVRSRKKSPPATAGGTDLSSQPYTRKLPPQVRVEKVAVCRAAVAFGCCDGRAAQDHLVDHEFAVVLADRTCGFVEARVGKICRVGPFPTKAPVEFAACRFPLKFCRQAHALPFRERGGFVIRNVTDRRVHLQAA